MRAPKCSWVEMMKIRQQLEAAESGKVIERTRCVAKQTIDDWKRCGEVINALEESEVRICGLVECQPSHAREIAKHFRKLHGKPDKWSDAVKAEIVGWVEKCEEEKLTVEGLRQTLKESLKDASASVVAEGVYGSLEEVIATGQKFGTIYADPPWGYRKQTRGAVNENYHTMTADELCELPVSEVAAEDSHIHLWTTTTMIREAFAIIDAWGFEYKSMAIWVKPGRPGVGNYWRISHEILLLGVRGDAKGFSNKSLRSWFEFPRGEHSEKPNEVRGMIESASPGPRLELFGRVAVDGWSIVGNQVSERDSS